MTQTRRLDKQAVGPGLAQKATQTDLKRRAIDAAHTATRHFGDSNVIASLAHQGRIQADLTELIDQHRPAFVWRFVRHQVLNQTGFAGAKRPGNHMGGNVLQHDRQLL